MELKKLSMCETIGCALLPCMAGKYRAKALQREDCFVPLLAKGLQCLTIGFYAAASLSVIGAIICYRSESTATQSIARCVSLFFAYMASNGGRHLYQQASRFRECYHDEQQFLKKYIPNSVERQV